MRLICVYQHAPTRDSPGFYRHRRYFAELVARGWQVDLVSCPVSYLTGEIPRAYSSRPYVREELDGITHHWIWAFPRAHSSRLRRSANYAAFAAGATLRGLTLDQPSVVWASSPPLPVGLVGAALARRFSCPWLFEIRDLWPESAASVGWLERDSFLYRRLEHAAKWCASHAASVIVPTPGLVRPAYVHGARNVDLLTGTVTDTSAPAVVRAARRAALGIPDGVCLFAYVGAHGVANGLDAVLDAAIGLAGEPVHFVLAGDGSDRQRLEERVDRESISNVTLVGVVGQDEVRELLAASDVCLHVLRDDPTFHAALGTKMLDYLGARRPFITTVDGVPRTIALASGGGYAPSGVALMNEFRRWSEMSAAERIARGEQAFLYGADHFSPARVADQVEGVLIRTIEAGRQSGSRD